MTGLSVPQNSFTVQQNDLLVLRLARRRIRVEPDGMRRNLSLRDAFLIRTVHLAAHSGTGRMSA